MAKVSIIIAAYNIEAYLEKCIASVIKQSCRDIEIIIINDGSTDGTLSVIENFSKIDNRIKVINQKNYGVSRARNNGIKASQGEFLFFLDGDDWIDEFAIEKLYDKAMLSNSDIVCYNYYYAYDDISIICSDFKKFKEMDNKQFLKSLLLLKTSPTLWSKFIKREIIIDNNIRCPENIAFGEDMAMGINISTKAKKITYLNEPLYFYRQRESSISQKLSKRILSIDESMKLIEKILIDEKLFEEFKKEYEYLVFRNIYHYLVISNNNTNDVHKSLYFLWKSRGIDIKENNYCVEFYEKLNNKSKFKYKLYDTSYFIGKNWSDILHAFKKVVK